MMRITVAAQKILQAREIGRLRRTDQDGPARSRIDEPDAAQDHRANKALAQIGVGHDQRSQLLGRNEDGLDAVFRNSIDKCIAARKLRNLPEKLAAAPSAHRYDVA